MEPSKQEWGNRLKSKVTAHPVVAVAAAVGAGLVATRFVRIARLRKLLPLAGAASALRGVAERLPPEVKQVSRNVLGLAVETIAGEVKRRRPSLSPQVEELQRSLLARLGEAEKAWRP